MYIYIIMYIYIYIHAVYKFVCMCVCVSIYLCTNDHKILQIDLTYGPAKKIKHQNFAKLVLRSRCEGPNKHIDFSQGRLDMGKASGNALLFLSSK